MESTASPSTAAWFLSAGGLFNLVYTPLLCLFGAMGNSLSVWVFCMSASHRNLSSSFYLSALAISDTGFLINLFAVWLTDIGFDVMSSRLTCPLIYYLGQVTSFLSVWLTVAFTVERFFAVCYPLTRPTVCTVARAKKVICGLTIVALLAFSYMWIIATVVRFRLDSSRQDASVPTTSAPSFGMKDGNRGEMSVTQLLESTILPIDENICTGESCMRYPSNEVNLSFRDEHRREEEMKSEADSYPENHTLNEVAENKTVTFKQICYVLEEYNHISRIANYADSALTFIVPFFLITFLNLRIALCVWKLRDQRDHIIAPPRVSNSLNLNQRSSSQRLKDQLNHSISVRKGGKCKTLFKNDSSVKFQECGISNPNMAPSNGNETSSHPFGKINLEIVKEDHLNCKNVDTSPNRLNRRNSISVGTPQKTNAFGCTSSQSSYTAAEVRVTKTLLLVSTVFLVLNLPSHAIRAIIFLKSLWGSNVESEELLAVQSWSIILFNTNYSVNFLLYCVSGRNFRKSLRNIFLGREGESNGSRRGTSIRSRSIRKSNRMTLNNPNANVGNGSGHRREKDMSLAKIPTDVEKQSLFPTPSVTEIEMETTYA